MKEYLTTPKEDCRAEETVSGQLSRKKNILIFTGKTEVLLEARLAFFSN